MTPELEHKIVEHIFRTNVFLTEVIEDNDKDPALVSREMSSLMQGHQLLEEIKNETRTVQQQSAATPAGGDGK